MTQDPTARVAAKLQAVYDAADAEEQAVLDELGALLGIVHQLATEPDAEVSGFGAGFRSPTTRTPTALAEVKARFAADSGASEDAMGNFQLGIQTSDFVQGLDLAGTFSTRWPPR